MVVVVVVVVVVVLVIVFIVMAAAAVVVAAASSNQSSPLTSTPRRYARSPWSRRRRPRLQQRNAPVAIVGRRTRRRCVQGAAPSSTVISFAKRCVRVVAGQTLSCANATAPPSFRLPALLRDPNPSPRNDPRPIGTSAIAPAARPPSQPLSSKPPKTLRYCGPRATTCRVRPRLSDYTNSRLDGCWL